MAGNLQMGEAKQARSDFDDRARRIANDIQKNGLSEDGVIAILMRNDIRLSRIFVFA